MLLLGEGKQGTVYLHDKIVKKIYHKGFGAKEFEDNMLEYNDHFFCGIVHKLQQERKENESLNRIDCASDVVPLRSNTRTRTPDRS